jgi:hypothetical protein
VRRLAAVALGVAFLSFVAQTARLHVHVYDDHDHAEHHHGIAAHGHHDDDHDEDDRARDSEEGEHFAPCEPESHVQSVAFCSTMPEPFPVLFASLPYFSFEPSEPTTDLVMVPVDARGHSPPRRPSRPLRAPPRQIPA